MSGGASSCLPLLCISEEELRRGFAIISEGLAVDEAFNRDPVSPTPSAPP